MANQPVLLAIGAHYDDCIYGIPGIMLKAIAKNYRVVILSLIGDYSNWPPVRGRDRELVEQTILLSREYGAEMQFLDLASHQYVVDEQTKRKVSEAVHAVKPDIAFHLWEYDHHNDHTVASQLSKIALRGGGRVINEDRFKTPSRIYQYDNGPGHTIGFEPDTFVDVTEHWDRAIAWLGRLMAIMQNREYDPEQPGGAERNKEILARYRGNTCGVQFAEALWSARKRPVEIL